MLRVGLTGDLGSGKSTVARMLAERGAVVLSSDETGRRLMEPDQSVYAQIVALFGEAVVARDGTLDRSRLAAVAFDAKRPRVEELNAIVHPAVLRVQAAELEELAAARPEAIAVVESALIFSTKYGSTKYGSTKYGTTKYAQNGSWRERFDRILLVEAPEEQKIARFVDRMAAGRMLSAKERGAVEADARRRLAIQHHSEYAADCLVLHNDGDIEQLEQRVEAVWDELKQLQQESSL